jgi:hypothetical protein
MATYYWTGARSSDVNDARNWSLWYTTGGLTGAVPPAPSKHGWGSDIDFVKYNIIGGTGYPLFSPVGTLTGTAGYTAGLSGGAGSTLGTRYLNFMTVQENCSVNIGSSNSTGYFNFYANNVYLNHASGAYNAAYLNPQQNPTDGSIIPYISIQSKAPGVNYYIKGSANIANSVAYNTYSTTTLYGLLEGTLNVTNNLSYDVFNIDTTTEFNNASMTISGKGNVVNIGKDFSLMDGTLNVNALTADAFTTINFLPVGLSGASGPADYPYSTYKLKTNGVNSNYPYINIQHGTWLQDLQLGAGHVHFNPLGPNDSCIVLQGVMNGDIARITVSDTNSVVFNSPGGGYEGFSCNIANSKNLPIAYDGNYSINLAPSTRYWSGNT